MSMTQGRSHLFRPKKTNKVMTLNSWLLADRHSNPIKTPKFLVVVHGIEAAGRNIYQFCSKANIQKGWVPTSSPYHNKKKPDPSKQEIRANEIVMKCLKDTGYVYLVYNTVTQKPEPLCEEHTDSLSDEDYIVAYNPLEGAENLILAFGAGFLFSVYKKSIHDLKNQTGNDMIMAGFFLFSCRCTLVLSIGGKGVQEFCYDEVIGEFVVVESNLTIPVRGSYYCVDVTRSSQWDVSTIAFVRQQKDTLLSMPKTFRNFGGLCQDMYATLKTGGICIYPATFECTKGTTYLLYEANPLAYIARAAGGMATTGYESPLDLPLDKPCRRRPLYLGSREDVVAFLEIATIRRAIN